jgi:hypothetical protein
LIWIIEVTRFIVSPQLAGLQKTLERGEHTDLERHVELARSQKLSHLLLHQSHDKPLPWIRDLDCLIVLEDAALPPLATILVLSQLSAIDRHRGHPANKKP